jgi:hypothetical protein
MNNVWSEHELKAADFAKLASIHFQKAAEFNDAGDFEQALHQALLAATDMEYSTLHAKQANDYCFENMIQETLEL